MADRLQLGPISFDDGRSMDAGITRGWFFRELTDWEGLTEIRGDLSARPVAHGSFGSSQNWRTSAVPSFVGVYIGDSAGESASAVRALVGACGGNPEMWLEFEDDDLTLGRTVRVRSVVPGARRGGATRRAVTVYVEAADPLLYGTPVSGSTGIPTSGVGIADPLIDPVQEGEPGNLGRIPIANAGSAPTSVKIDVSGGLSEGVQVQVIETGEVLRLERLIPDGSTITMNSRTGRARIDAQSDVTGFLTVDQWPQIPAESTRTFQFTPLGTVTGSPTMTVSARPAYF